jgi:DUF4097 and DUF4098 domain-containing protein YvlB
MQDLQREILSQVAAGTLSAEDAAARLEALEAEPSVSTPPRPGPTPGPASGVRHVRVLNRLGNTEITGDPSVSYAFAEGPHKARQEGDTMIIEQSPLDDEPSFEFSRPSGRIRVPGINVGGELTVRMNPALPLAAKTQAGNIRITGLNGAIAAEVQAGNCDIVDFRGPINLRVTAGNVTAKGRLDSGESAIRCQMGEVRVVLDKTSSVRIRARTTMGEISFENAQATGRGDLVLGSGAATLDCDCTMGTIRIVVE